MLVTMKEILDIANENNYAVAAPNVESELTIRACIEAAEEMNAPIIIDIAPPMVTDIVFIGKLARELAIQSKVPVAINLDHSANKQEVIQALQGGFTSVMFDKSSLSDEENIAQVKEIAELVHTVDVSIEAEYGHVGQANNYANDRDARLTSPELAKNFVEKTGVDCLAVAIGTAHGSYPKGFKPYLDFERLKEIKEAINIPLVLHGSSGTDEESIRKACRLGINKVNISNDLCKEVVNTIVNGDFSGNKAYDVFPSIKEAIKKKLMYMIEIYGSKDKAWAENVIGANGLPIKKISGEER